MVLYLVIGTYWVIFHVMLTVGDILKKARAEKRITLEQAEKDLRIRRKFLLALEENAWQNLPSLPYIKGFLRNYSKYLGLAPDEMIAFFRRQYVAQEKAGLLPSGIANPLDQALLRFTPKLSAAILVFVFVGFFIVYLFIQYLSFSNPPALEIHTPKEGEVTNSSNIIVSGSADSDAVISINNQKIALSDEGKFSTSVSLNPGVNTIVVEATSKFGKKRTVSRMIQATF